MHVEDSLRGTQTLASRLLALQEVLSGPRGSGRTTALVKATKSVGGILLTHSYEFSRRLECESLSISPHIDNLSVRINGRGQPVFLDHYLLSGILFTVELQLRREVDRARDVSDLLAQGQRLLQGLPSQ